MTVIAQGSRSGIGWISEVTWGTTPSTPVFADMVRTTSNLEIDIQSLESKEIRSDRQIADYRHGNQYAMGDVDFEFRSTDYDAFLASAFFGTINTGVLKVGTTLSSFSMEEQQLDIAQYRLFTGMYVDKFSMSVKPGEIVTCKASFVGQNMTLSGTSASGSARSAGAGFAPFDSYTGTIKEGGSVIATITALNFSINNNMKAAYVIGSKAPIQFEYGRSQVTGSLTAYFTNATLYNKFLNETVSSAEFTLTDGTNTYDFLFPYLKYTKATIPIQNEQSRILTMDFIALLDPSSPSTNLQLTITGH